jgi:hypothetical protein
LEDLINIIAEVNFIPTENKGFTNWAFLNSIRAF